MGNSEEDIYRFQALEGDVKSLQEAVYGDRAYVGLTTRMQVLEARLQIFWWVLAIIGSSVIAIAVNKIFKSIGEV